MNALLIFAKYPEPGRVKTRLARTIGEVEAARRYREMIETVMQKTRTQNGEYHRTLYFDPPGRRDDFQRWFPDLDLSPQVSGDLGRRMEAAFFEKACPAPQEARGGKGGFNRAILIGTDCPDVDRHLVVEAFEKLKQNDLVIGPATDGGYYLIGMKTGRGVLQYAPTLFEGIPWSTDKVLRETLEKAEKVGLTVELLKTLSDVDR